jgi:phosphate-selective porin OprO/OprP
VGRRRLGVVVVSYGEHWKAYGGVFGEGIDDAGTDNSDWGVAGRAVWAPFAEKTKVLTFGSSVNYRKFESTSSLRYRIRPGAHIAGARLIDTGVLPNAKQTLEWNVETSFVYGRFHGQAEYTGTEVTRRRGEEDLRFGGWYVQTGVFLTGESRNYDVKSGKYKGIKPLNKYGAVELAVRYGTMDLSNNKLRGGQALGVTGGVNWWINQNIMMRFNYIYGDVSPNSSVTNLGLDEKIHAFTARTQIVF